MAFDKQKSENKFAILCFCSHKILTPYSIENIGITNLIKPCPPHHAYIFKI